MGSAYSGYVSMDRGYGMEYMNIDVTEKDSLVLFFCIDGAFGIVWVR